MTMIITWLASAIMADYLLAGSRDLDPEPGVLAKADASNMGFGSRSCSTHAILPGTHETRQQQSPRTETMQ